MRQDDRRHRRLRPHQANKRIIDYAVAKLGVPPERTVVNVDRFGNTSSGSIPLALADARAEGRLHDGALVLMTGMGAGLTWGSALIEWGGSSACRESRLERPRRTRWAKSHSVFRARAPSRPAWAVSSRRPCRRDGRVPGRQRGVGLDLQKLCFDSPLEALVETKCDSRPRRDLSRHPRRDPGRGNRAHVVVGHSVGESARSQR